MPRTPYVQSKDQLKEYIKRRLGYPVVNVELTDEQLDDVINEAIEKFYEVAYPAQQIRIALLTAQEGKREYELPYEVIAVVRVFNPGSVGVQFGVFGPNVTMAQSLEKIYFQKLDLVSMELIREYIATLETMFSNRIYYDFNCMTRKLYFYQDPGNQKYGLLYYENPNENEDLIIYDHRWIKAYSTALARLQWGRNLLKYAGSMLPSGLQMNAEALISEAKEDISKLEEELEDKYQLPIDFFIG